MVWTVDQAQHVHVLLGSGAAETQYSLLEYGLSSPERQDCHLNSACLKPDCGPPSDSGPQTVGLVTVPIEAFRVAPSQLESPVVPIPWG